MFAKLWRDLFPQRKPARRTALHLEALEDRCLLSAALSISHMSNNNWTAGLTNFNGAMTISGGTAPYSIVSDSGLPPGTTPVIKGDLIEFTGTPSVAKTFDPTITIKDAAGDTASRNFVISVDPAIIIGNLTQNQWTVSEAGFNGAMTIGGGTGPFTLTASSGLPTGLTAELNGTTIHFSGSPTAVGTFAKGSVTISDADGATLTQNFSITINAAPTISAPVTTQWTVGETGLPDILTITGGTAPYSIASYGNLPFTPALGGNSVFFVGNSATSRTLTDGFITIRDVTGATVTEDFPPFTVNLQPSVSNLSTNEWTVNQPGFNGTYTIYYGTAPFKIIASQNLPTGLVPVISGTTISFTGTPTAARSFGSGTLTIEDSGDDTFTVDVNINIHPALTITTTSLPVATDNAHYSTALQATGGTGADTYTLTGGSLPTGMSLSSNGTISGTSSAVGTFSFTATVTDAIGDHVSQDFTLAISPAIAIGDPTATQWTVSEAGFKSTMTITGGSGAFAITSATGLPTGMSATLSGHTITITGTPTALGTFSHGSITVADSLGGTFVASFSIAIVGGPKLTNLAQTAWTANVAGFAGTLTISGGTGPYTLVSAKHLPFSPVIVGNTILFTGSGGSGTYANGVITVRDVTGATVTENITPITINQQATIYHMTNNNWTADFAGFNGVLPITGGTEPFTIIDARNLPPGLTPVVEGNQIAFTGIPTAPRNYGNASITIEDAAGVTTSRSFVFQIAPPLVITTTNLPAWRSGQNYSTTLQTSGGTGADTFTLTGGALPPGLALNSNGKIHGVATAVGSFTFTITATDSLGDKFSETFTL